MSIKHEVNGVVMSVLTDGDGYSYGADSGFEHSVEIGLWPKKGTFSLPSQVGLSERYDNLFDGDQDYGGVAAYVPFAVYQRMLADFLRLGPGVPTSAAGTSAPVSTVGAVTPVSTARRCAFDLGDRVQYHGNSAFKGTVVSFEISTHPAFSDQVTVQWDNGLTMLVMNEDRNVVDMYAAALKPLTEED